MTLISVGIACLLIGSSMAYLIFEAQGTTQTISAGTLQLSYTNESEAVSLNNAVPQSNEQGLNNDTYSITLTNTSTIKSYYELSLNNNCTVGNSYTINGSSVTANVCIPNNYIKVAVKTSNDEDYTIKNGGNVILKGYLEAKENISFEMIIWLTEETPNDYQGQTEEGTLRNVIYNGNFKIYTRQILDIDNNLDSSGANEPELASNMIPVYYDEAEEVWKKADKYNSKEEYRWYSYESNGDKKGMWANAVTVTETNRTTYLNAEPGTTIPMTDITTMWVWIPRFNANMDTISSSHCEDRSYNIYECSSNGKEVVLVKNPNAIDITFVKANETAIDAFTFGNQELSGFWYGKFETSHTTLASSTTENNLGCTNETCINANGIIIKPNVISLRNNNTSNFFLAARSMEQTGNSFGFVNTEVDTHMSKNNEWGAVAYLTQSIYGRCTSGTACDEVYANTSSEYYTGRSADSPYDKYTNSKTYKYNQNKTGLTVVEGTGTIIIPTITNDTTYPWTNNNGIYSSGNSTKSNTKSTLIYTFTLTEKGVVSFDYSVSSENTGDEMKYTISKESTTVVTGTTISGTAKGTSEALLQYDSKTHVLEAGTYILKFTYQKDDAYNYGLDKGYVKNVKVLSGAQTIEKTVGLGGQKASTTGTIYGIYDMAGGAGEYVMGLKADANGNPIVGIYDIGSGFTGMMKGGTTYIGVPFPDSKYYNLYAGTGTFYMGHALTETFMWYGSGNDAGFSFDNMNWFFRGGWSWSGFNYCVGIFCTNMYTDVLNIFGNPWDMISTRFVITNE